MAAGYTDSRLMQLRRDAFNRESAPVVLLWLVALVPAWLVVIGHDGGEVSFVLYREPKLAAVTAIGWLFLAVWAWSRRGHWSLVQLVTVIRRPPVLALVLLVGYLSLSVAWTTVRANALYELQQWYLLTSLLVVISVWALCDSRPAVAIRWSLCTAAAGVAAVGLLQAVGLFPWLPGINPFGEVAHPSLMGYKNPAALMVLGQLFLLPGLLQNGMSRSPIRDRCILVLIMVAEVGYILSLQSRASFAGLLVGTLVVVVGSVVLRRSRRVVLGATLALGGLAILTAITAATSPAVRAKLRSTAEVVVSPSSYLDTDRGVFLRNTLVMARANPFGVGVGDWQTQYPVYRRFDRYRAFNASFQVRRAHSDMVQMLGEAGWPGALLWLAFLGGAAAVPLRAAFSERDLASLWNFAQLVAVGTAMVFDYFSEHPFLKLQLVLLVAIATAGRKRRYPTSATYGNERVVQLTAALVLTLAAAVQGTLAVLAVPVYMAGAKLNRAHQKAVVRAKAGLLDRQALTPCCRQASFLLRGIGFTKTRFRELAMAAQACHLLDQDAAAMIYLENALRLAPYHPNTMLLAAEVVPEPELARRWREAAEYVLHEAVAGFEGPYPELHVSASERNPATLE